MTKYPQLTGICKKAVENKLCLGCSKLENLSFVGQDKCEYVVDPLSKIHTILGVQERIKI